MQQFIKTCSPATATVTLSVAASTPISPNRVSLECTPGTADGGLLFQVSPDSTGFLLREGDTAMPVMTVRLPDTSETVVAGPPPLGEAVAFDISSSIPGSETPGMSVPLPPGMMLMPVSCSAQTVLAPGFPSQSGRWSSAIPQTHNITQEGPFDAYCSPMDTGDYPLVSMGLPGCPYRGWAGWHVYITEQSEGSVISYYYYYVTSYYDVCMRCLGDVSRCLCGVTRSFLWELSCCCGLERDGCML